MFFLPSFLLRTSSDTDHFIQWEGISDIYAEGLALGGVFTAPGMNFNLQIAQVNAGENSWENPVQMAINHKTFGPYHDDKRAKVEVKSTYSLWVTKH